MGPSGSGKSTLLTLAGGLDTPTAGEVYVEGSAPARVLTRSSLAKLRRRSIGYVFQDFNLIPALTAAENVALPRELDGARTRAAAPEALAALDEVGLPELADRFPDEMSGGQQQRVAIARASSETGGWSSPTSRPAPWTPRPARPCCSSCAAGCDAGAAGVLVTHEARHAAWADRVVFLRDGVLVDDTGPQAAPESLLQEPRW